MRIRFPRNRDEQRRPLVLLARLFDACDEGEPDAPDLVLLRPERIPADVLALQIARSPAYEYGAGFAHAFLPSRRKDIKVHGEIDDLIDADGTRRFRDGDGGQYWFESGSSGSPVFVGTGQQLAGLIRLAELGQAPASKLLARSVRG